MDGLAFNKCSADFCLIKNFLNEKRQKKNKKMCKLKVGRRRRRRNKILKKSYEENVIRLSIRRRIYKHKN